MPPTTNAGDIIGRTYVGSPPSFLVVADGRTINLSTVVHAITGARPAGHSTSLAGKHICDCCREVAVLVVKTTLIGVSDFPGEKCRVDVLESGD